ncbi:glycosyltransferase family 2 protein [Flavihumibacter stibioxidans]|uniref:Family 2 glycosyl transferase n=1 Tax=Flavihumibacter stibioxidans TaxID=1834163 RepID=A0ABR7M6F2_9BACT|nr:glycosyltransferase family 2 protein [Flavihumibacter stibioxidans]MBC6490594.1 family 2 glycosyl transferase [Flavihumibacter stibioxidans]
MEITLVIAVYNEADNIVPLLKAVETAMDGFDYEVVIVDDGSIDGTLRQLRENIRGNTRVLALRKNYGQSLAMAAGINVAEGDFIATLDGDLQNDPADIPAMLQLAKDGQWDLVAGVRKNRQDGFILRKIPSRIANLIIRNSTKVMLHDYGCTLKVFRNEIAQSLGLYGDMHRFIPVLAALQGARMTEMEVRHHPRIHGSSKYGIGRTILVISDLFFVLFMKKYFQRPMHIFGPAGILIFMAGAVINGFLLVRKLQGEQIAQRPLLLVGIIFLLAGLQLVLTGILAEIMMRTYYESQQKQPYRVRDIILPKKGSI